MFGIQENRFSDAYLEDFGSANGSSFEILESERPICARARPRDGRQAHP